MRSPGASFKTLSLILLVTALSAAQGTAAPGRERVSLVVAPTLSAAPFYLAAARGYFSRFGLEADVINISGDAAVQTSLNLGRVDLVYGSVRPLVWELVARGGRVRIVASGTEIPTTCTSLALVASSQFAARHPRLTVADLRRARVGNSSPRAGGLGDFLLTTWLERAGLTDDDVEQIRVPIPLTVDALARGAVDAAVVTEPYLSAAIVRGAGVIVARAQTVAPRMPVVVVMMGPSLRNRPGLAARVLAAYLLGVRDYMAPDARRNPETLRILAQNLAQSEDAFRQGCWQPIPLDGRVNTKALQVLGDWLVARGFITGGVAAGQLVEERHLKEAWRLLESAGEATR